jgi:serine/threonine-protein kinase
MDEYSSLLTRKVFLPAEKILETDPFLGFDYTMPGKDRVLRHQPLVMNYEGYYYPSVELLAAARYLDVPADQIEVIEGSHILVGNKRSIPINEKSEMFVTFSDPSAFSKYSAVDVLGEGFNFDLLKDKTVIIGIDDFDAQTFRTPVSDQTPPLVVRASVIENIINDNMLIIKDDMAGVDMLILFALGALCAFVLPQVSALYRFVILFGGLFLLANANYFLLSSFRIIGQTVYIGLELILFMIASPLQDMEIISGKKRKKSKKKKLPEVDIKRDAVVGAIAGPVVREIKSTEHDAENQPTAVLVTDDALPKDYQAINLCDEEEETSATAIPGSGERDETGVISDSDQLAIQAESDPDAVTDQEETSDKKGSLLADSDLQRGTEVTNLGRYQITGTLGKGAMGHVYKGIDPAINRPVALKTIRLDFVNDPAEMEGLKKRLFREAQAAGKLSHPNIVTIYDVGSEGHLQYIAMEYLEGETLEDMIKRKTKFNYRIIAQIIVQICSALDYAHQRGIVHRDIKPANIMITKDYSAKVMDYGIARLDTSSMTKTGMAMGTPNYISPEQIQGKLVDHRADLFSLGVVMYEMLLGRRPFKGENITSLMHAIIHHEPEKPSTVNPDVPLLFDHAVAKCLKKEPSERYQRATEIADDLADFVESFATR